MSFCSAKSARGHEDLFFCRIEKNMKSEYAILTFHSKDIDSILMFEIFSQKLNTSRDSILSKYNAFVIWEGDFYLCW